MTANPDLWTQRVRSAAELDRLSHDELITFTERVMISAGKGGAGMHILRVFDDRTLRGIIEMYTGIPAVIDSCPVK